MHYFIFSEMTRLAIQIVHIKSIAFSIDKQYPLPMIIMLRHQEINPHQDENQAGNQITDDSLKEAGLKTFFQCGNSTAVEIRNIFPSVASKVKRFYLSKKGGYH